MNSNNTVWYIVQNPEIYYNMIHMKLFQDIIVNINCVFIIILVLDLGCIPATTVRISQSIWENDVAAKPLKHQFYVLPICQKIKNKK